MSDTTTTLGCPECTNGAGLSTTCATCGGSGLDRAALRVLRQTAREDFGEVGYPFLSDDGEAVLVPVAAPGGVRVREVDTSAALAYFAVKASRASWTRDLSVHPNS